MRLGSQSLSEYLKSFKKVCDGLAAIQKPITDDDKVIYLSRGLGEKYNVLVTSMLSKPPFPSYSQFVTAVQGYALRLHSMTPESPQTDLNVAFFATNPNGGGRGRGHGRGKGHYNNGFNSKGRGFAPASQNYNNQHSGSYGQNHQHSQELSKNIYASKNHGFPQGTIPQQPTSTPNGFSYTKPPLICQICDRRGHSAVKCWYRWDYAYQARDDVPQAMAIEEVDPTLYVDTGASAHITNDAGNLTNLAPYKGSDKIMIGDGSHLNISHTGDCIKFKNIKLNNVLVVPKIKKNLVSVSKLARDNTCVCEFSDSTFVIKAQATGRILASGNRQGKLYALNKDAVTALVAIQSGKAPEAIWHQRLGHPNSSFLKVLSSQNVIDVNKWSKTPPLCSSCELGKSCKLPFSLRNKSETAPLNKIHSDLWGPAPVSSFQGMKYCAVFVDDFSRFTWLYPLKKKSEFYSTFLKFQSLVENQLSRKIKIFQSDGGGEFQSTELIQHLEKCGIQRQLSCPGTPEQNGVAERKHRHIVETGLTMLFHAKLPKFFWVEAFLTAVFLINRLPSQAIAMESPFYRLFSRHPDYSILKVFGCRCFPYLKDRASTKFEPKSYPCIFIGYSSIHKGFRCYHPPSRKVYISRHVVFNEHTFPYADPPSLCSSSQDNSTMTTYVEFDQWQNPEQNNSLTQVLEGEQLSTMAKFSASTESQNDTCPCSVDLPLSSALDEAISHHDHQSSRLSSAPSHNSTQLDTIVPYDAAHDTSPMPHGSHESNELGAATLPHPSLGAANTSRLALHLPQELPISTSSQEPQQAPTTDAAMPIVQMGHSMVTRSQHKTIDSMLE